MTKQMIVQIQALRKTYPGAARAAVDNIELNIPSGEIFGLLGPNGAGKTTLLSMLSGLLRPDSGALKVAGHDVRHRPEAVKRAIGLVPQELALYPSLSARENLYFFGRLFGLRGARLTARVTECLRVGQLEEVAERRAATYSGGLKRRLNLVIGLIHEPQLLILDEPTVGIDPQSRNFIHDSLRDLNRAGMSILYTTHYMEEVESLCERVAIIDHGHIIAAGRLTELLATYQNGAIEVHTAADVSEAARQALAALPEINEIVVSHQSITLTSRAPLVSLRALLAVLADHHVPVASLSLGTAHLEQIFLSLTGTRLRD